MESARHPSIHSQKSVQNSRTVEELDDAEGLQCILEDFLERVVHSQALSED